MMDPTAYALERESAAALAPPMNVDLFDGANLFFSSLFSQAEVAVSPFYISTKSETDR